MERIIKLLRTRFPGLVFTESNSFYWSPEAKEVFYAIHTTDRPAIWSLLHETSHGLLQHRTYQTDLELLQLETAAWERAKVLANDLSTTIDDDHIQDCLDTYRDWLHARSTCPTCGSQSLQQPNFCYKCYNCHAVWKVTPSRFCRTYRSVKGKEESSRAASIS